MRHDPFIAEEDGLSLGSAEFLTLRADIEENSFAHKNLTDIILHAELQESRYHLPDKIMPLLAQLYINDASIAVRDEMPFAADSLSKAQWLVRLSFERGIMG